MLRWREVEEINTMGKISSQAETLALMSEERNALPESWAQRVGKGGGGRIFNPLLISKILDPDFDGPSYQERNSCFANSCSLRDAATGEAGTEGAILGSQISPGTRLQSLGNVTV